MTLQEAPMMPATHPILGLFGEFQKDPLGLFEQSRQYGDVVRMRFANRTNFVLHHPEAIQQVLVKQAKKFRKDDFIRNAFEPFIGNGLTISEGDHWKRQRKLIAPAFHAQRIQNYADTMVEQTHNLIAEWQQSPQRDIQEDIVRLNTSIIGLTLFGEDVSNQSDYIREQLIALNTLFTQRAQQINVPRWLPTPHNRALDQAVAAVDAIVVPLIEKRQLSGEDKGDLLSMLLLSETEDGQHMTPREVRDEAVTLFLAGNDTTSAALTWIFYLLSQHPDVVQKIREEVDTIAPDGRIRFEQLRQFAYLDSVIKEAQRIYPAAWGFSRECIEDADIMGYKVPKKSIITLPIWAMHRHPHYWDEPEVFNPERFANADTIPKYTYFPFGGGARVCIGNSLATMQMQLVVATVLQHVDIVQMVSDAPKPNPTLVLQPATPLVLKVAERQRQSDLIPS